MTNKSKQRGTAFESSVLPIFQAIWPDAHRLGSQGAKDCGDIWLPATVPMAVECKNLASYGGRLSGWLQEAHVEAMNAGKQFGVVVHKRHGNGHPDEQYVTMELGDFQRLAAQAFLPVMTVGA